EGRQVGGHPGAAARAEREDQRDRRVRRGGVLKLSHSRGILRSSGCWRRLSQWSFTHGRKAAGLDGPPLAFPVRETWRIRRHELKRPEDAPDDETVVGAASESRFRPLAVPAATAAPNAGARRPA